MKEYNVIMTFSLESDDATFESIIDYANELSKKISMSEDIVSVNADVRIDEINVDHVEDLNGDEDSGDYGYDDEYYQ